MSPLAEVTPRAEAEELLLLDQKTLDPNQHYRWVANNRQQISRRMTQGYRLVSRKEDKVKVLVDNDGSPDDHIYFGDSVLMCCAKSLVQERRRRTSAVAEGRLSSPVSAFKNQLQRSGAVNSKVLVDEEGE